MIVKRIAFSLLAIVVGVLGIGVLIGVGEGTGSGVAAYAADAVLFGVTAYTLARVDPAGGVLYAVLLCAPVLVISLMGPDSGGAGLALLMTAVTVLSAILTRATARPKR